MTLSGSQITKSASEPTAIRPFRGYRLKILAAFVLVTATNWFSSILPVTWGKTEGGTALARWGPLQKASGRSIKSRFPMSSVGQKAQVKGLSFCKEVTTHCCSSFSSECLLSEKKEGTCLTHPPAAVQQGPEPNPPFITLSTWPHHFNSRE